MYWYCFCLFKMGFSHVMYRDSFILNWCLVLAVSKTEEQSLEHLSKESLVFLNKHWLFFRDVLKLLKSSLHIRRTKKDKPTEKTNYRPISILSNISKICERLVHDSMRDYFSDVKSKSQCGFRKGFGTQNCLLYIIETIWKTRENHRMFAAVMTDYLKPLIAFPTNF